jgi:alkylation response protein AidB-like acyl-CoA dehydrogenase
MRFAFTDEQDDLRATVRAFVERHAGPAALRAAIASDDGFAAEIWAPMIDQMALTAIAVDEESGGAGATFVEVGIVLEELGRALVPVPYLPTVVAAQVLAEGADRTVADAFLERIVEGARAAVALPLERPDGRLPTATPGSDGGWRIDGRAEHVLDGQLAEFLVVAAWADGEPELFAVDTSAGGVTCEARTALDLTRRQAAFDFAQAPALRIGARDARAPAERACDLLRVALAVESVGAASRCLSLTVEYLRERMQFGRPLSSFQALRHRCADLAAELEAATSTAYYAAWAAGHAAEELWVAAPMAKAVASEAFLRTAAETIQLHGGIGFTWEHDAHLYFKRAKSTELLFGSPRELRRLVGDRVGIL